MIEAVEGKKRRFKKDVVSMTPTLHLKNCSVTRNGKYYPQYAIAQSYRLNGKRQKRIIKYLHRLTDDEAAAYRASIDAFNIVLKSGKPIIALDSIRFKSSKSYLNVETWLFFMRFGSG
jgi:hypothetical protein